MVAAQEEPSTQPLPNKEELQESARRDMNLQVSDAVFPLCSLVAVCPSQELLFLHNQGHSRIHHTA